MAWPSATQTGLGRAGPRGPSPPAQTQARGKALPAEGLLLPLLVLLLLRHLLLPLRPL
jgi:hypothetical protein